MAIAAAAFADLPEDVQAEILSRLPVKTLLRFKSVCKRWCALIENPSFIALHSHNCIAKFSDWILVVRYSIDQYGLSLSLVDDENRIVDNLDVSFTGIYDFEVDVLGCFNGVICLACFRGRTIFFFNPATREFKQIPQPKPYRPDRINHLGFAFDPKANDFKVVRIATGYEGDFSFENPFPYYYDAAEKVQIYDLSSDLWREIDAVVPEYIRWYGHPLRCTSLDGVVYWTATNEDRTDIVSFRSFHESIEQIPLPDAFPVNFSTTFCILKDSLALVVSEYQDVVQESNIVIWIRDTYGGKGAWTKKYTIGPVTGHHHGWGIRRNGELLLTRSRDNQRSGDIQMMLFDVDTQDVKEYHLVDDTPGPKSCVVGTWVNPYTESLISVKRRVD